MSKPITPEIDLHDYDLIVISSSAGKDSQTTLDVMVEMAKEQNFPRYRMIVVHADLGDVEWEGTKELAEEQAKHYKLRFEVVRKIDTAAAPADLLERVRVRGKFPDSGRRWCTSDHKRNPIHKLYTQLSQEYVVRGEATRILSCMGMRAEESPARAKKPVFKNLKSNKNQHVDEFLPIHAWTEDQVWDRIKETGVRHHPAYDWGMPRLSCSFCVLASKAALVRAAQLRPEKAAEYAAVEAETGHSFQKSRTMASIIEEAAETDPPAISAGDLGCDGPVDMVPGWVA